jgi:hypothetical protein
MARICAAISGSVVRNDIAGHGESLQGQIAPCNLKYLKMLLF